MASTLPSNSTDCLNNSCGEDSCAQVPGPRGFPGADGTNGTDGVNAYTTTTASFVMPAQGGTVDVEVLSSVFPSVGQMLYVEGAGHFLVDAKPDATTLTLENPSNFNHNATPGDVIPSSEHVSPAGLKGNTGATGASVTLNDISPTTTKGDILVDNGANNPDANVVRLAAGANGTRAKADSTQPAGLLYAKVDLSETDEVTGELGITNGGTGADNAADARTALGLGALAVLDTVDDTVWDAGGVQLAVTNGGTGSDNELDARRNLGTILPRRGLLGYTLGVALDSGGDTAIDIEGSRYRIEKVVVESVGGGVTTGVAGVFVGASGTGLVIAGAQALSALFPTNRYVDLTLDSGTDSRVYVANQLYFFVDTADANPTECNVWIFGMRFD